MRVLWVTLAVLLVDHFTKVLVKTNMYLGQSIALLGDWLKLTFTENPGMAFGVTFGMPLLVTVFAMLATMAILVYLWHARTARLSYRLSLALVLGGAIGNIIDRVFYGRIFEYAGFFRGEVVDFIHVNVYNGPAAAWIPFIGGQYVTLFPIWNVADMAIVVGVFSILVFHRQMTEPEPAEPVVAMTPEAAAALTRMAAVSTGNPGGVVPDTDGRIAASVAQELGEQEALVAPADPPSEDERSLRA